jgi:glycosyltransferase involved in cell wall biosynthesis
MATYNGEKYLTNQIRSILDQLSDEDELVVSDDHSSDNTIAVLESFNDSRIIIFHNANYSGPIGNFEYALQQARGDFVFLADQDDIWIEGRIKKHLELLQEYDLVISDAVVVNESGEVLYDSFFVERQSKSGLINNLIRNSYLGCCMSFRKCLLKKILPFPRKIHMHDWWIGLVAEVNGNVNFCNDKLLKYVRHGHNASPTLEGSGYTLSKKLSNRLVLVSSLVGLYFRRNK